MKTLASAKKTALSTSRQHKPMRTEIGALGQDDHVRDIPSQIEKEQRFGHSLNNIAVGQNAASPAGGNTLPEQLRQKMERSLGHDLSAVRFHEDAQVPQLGAAAYTRGTDVHFAPGMYQPHSLEGQAMIGHELAHVVQQRIGRVKPTSAHSINADAALEHEADIAGKQAAQGKLSDVAGPQQNSSSVGGTAVQMFSLSALKPSEERKKSLKKYGMNLLSTGASGAGSILSSVLGAALKGGNSGDIFNAFKESGTKAAGTLGSSALSGLQGVLHPGQAETGKADAATSDASAAPAATAADTTKDTGTATADNAATSTSDETATPAASSNSVSDAKTPEGTSNADSKIEELKPWKPALQQIIKIIDS
jgi:hypothetical protein